MPEHADYAHPARAVVAEALASEGVSAFDLVETAPILGGGRANLAALVRIEGAAPRIVIVEAPGGFKGNASDPVGALREAGHRYDHAARETRRLLERFEIERDRAAIERVLRQSAAGEMTRDQAAEALGRDVFDILKLEREFGIHASPRYVTGEEDILHDLEALDAKVRAEREFGRVPAIDHETIKRLRRSLGWDDERIGKLLGFTPGTRLPTDEEIALDAERRFYGIDADTPVGLTATVRVGTRHTRIVIETTDGRTIERVADATHAGRNLGRYASGELDRMLLGITEPRR